MKEIVELEQSQIPSSIGKWKAYPAYKDSGVEWLGEIPEHWEKALLKRCLTSLKDGTHGTFERVVQGVPLLSAKNVINGQVVVSDRESLISIADYEAINRNGYLCSGDLLLTIVGTIGRAAIFNLSEPVAFQRSVAVLRLQFEQSVHYFYYLTQSRYFQAYLVASTNQSAQGGVYLNIVACLPVVLPSISEQHTIATFLDHETGKINQLIARKERLIELLQEKRAALISHAVTKGLDLDVKVRDSGVAWLGEIPEHWKIGKLGSECIVKARLGWKGLKADEYVDAGYIFLSTPNIKSRDIDFENVNFITEYRYFESPEIMLKTGDVLIAKDGSTLGTTNVIRKLPAPATVNSSIAVLRPGGMINSVYLYWFLSSGYIQGFIQSMKGGMGVPHLFQADLRKFVVLMPPAAEQQAIATYLDHETARIDALISRIGEAIEKLKEYGAALISAAVTGKIDVRGEV